MPQLRWKDVSFPVHVPYVLHTFPQYMEGNQAHQLTRDYKGAHMHATKRSLLSHRDPLSGNGTCAAVLHNVQRRSR